MRQLRLPLAALVLSCLVSATAPATANLVYHEQTNNSVAAPLVISEFRLRGPNGPNDEFVEIYNTGDADHTVAAADGSLGYSVVASDGVARFTIPNGTVIPARGHFLAVNPVGYSLGSYPAGNATTANGDAAFTLDIPDNAGLALFKTANPANFNAATRLDAVGHQAVANALYREGAGLPNLIPYNVDYSIHRNAASGLPADTGDNASDFLLADTNGTNVCASTAAFRCQRLGAPGPENMSSPRRGANTSAQPRLNRAPVDPFVGYWTGVNRARDTTSDPADNSTYGTLTFRRTFVNDSLTPITRLRFRVVNLSTFPSPPGTADLRVLSSSSVVVTRSDGVPVTVLGTTLEGSNPSAQPNGGGFNSSLSAASVTLATPLAPGAGVHLQFRFGVQQQGSLRLGLVSETLPLTNSARWVIESHTEADTDREPSDVPDGVAPTTTATLSPAANAAGWHNRDATVALTASDEHDQTDGGDVSGVREITYSASGAQNVPATTVAGPQASFVVSAEGTTVITYSAKDNEGNVEETKTVTVRLDKTAPAVRVASPQGGLYLLNQAVAAAYTCSDFDPDTGSEKPVACSGTSPSGGPVNTSTLGMKSFIVTATDAAGNASSAHVVYHVAYDVALLYDPSAGHGGGAQIRLKVQLRDANGANHSSPSVAVTAMRVTPRGNPAVTVREESGAFVFDPALTYQGSPPGGYVYRFKATGLAPGEYDLVFMVEGESLLHRAAPFRIN